MNPLASNEVVLLHDWLTGFRGGERVLEVFCEMFPDAPIYTLLHKLGSTSSIIEGRQIKCSMLDRVPGVDRNYRKLLPLMPAAVNWMRIGEPARLVLSSHHCAIKGIRKPPGALHISYIHSPMRYMYDQFDNYFGIGNPLSVRAGGRFFRGYLTRWDRSSNSEVDIMIANSHFVRTRIQRYYAREAHVVHPFVELDDFKSVQHSPPEKSDRYVIVSAFAPNKRVDLAIETFNRLRLPLDIIGTGQQERRLRAMAGNTIHFHGSLNRSEVIATLARSRALIFPGVEDFGITPLEAICAGTPVIALRAGGVLETLTEDDTVFFDEPTTSGLADAIQRFQSKVLRPSFDRMQRFSKQRFVSEMRAIIDHGLSTHRAAGNTRGSAPRVEASARMDQG
ncbi:MAG: glycosyltransferase [Pseudomonadota bacterium]